MMRQTIAKGASKGAFGLDAGLLWNVAPFLRAGASVRHANRPDPGLADTDAVPLEARAGLMGKWSIFRLALEAKLRDCGKDVADSQKITRAFGLEASLLEPSRAGAAGIKLRAGANDAGFSAGARLWIGNTGFDYACMFSSNLSQDNSGTHQAALTYRWGKAQ